MDNLGNRTDTITHRDGVRHYTTDALTNRYTAINSPTQNLFYDLAGNLTQDHNGYHYVYDHENRITRIFKDINANRVYDSGIDTNIAEYAYDALGRRIKKVDAIASETTVYYYSDNWQVLAEYDGSGGFQAYYVFGNYIDEVLLRHVIPAQAGIQDFYYLHDHLYNPVALLDDTGTVIERCEYDAYGKVTIWNAAFTTTYTTSQHGNPYAFTGRELDTLDGGNCTLYHYRHRDYSPPLARFFQHDPHGINPAGGKNNAFYFENQYADGVNIYQYVISNPILVMDPMGTTPYRKHKQLRDAIKIYQRKTACGNCGPDVTSAMFDSLQGLRTKLVEYFNSDPKNKDNVCGFNGIYNTGGWDFLAMHMGEKYMTTEWGINYQGYPSGGCSQSIKLAGKCYNKWEVNYYLWGFLNRICGNNEYVAIQFADKWSRFKDLFPSERTLTQCKVAFTRAGFQGSTGIPSVPSYCEYSKCDLNVPDYFDDKGLEPRVRGLPGNYGMPNTPN